MRSGQGFLLVYAVNDLKSFEELRNLYDEILRIKVCVCNEYVAAQLW